MEFSLVSFTSHPSLRAFLLCKASVFSNLLQSVAVCCSLLQCVDAERDATSHNATRRMCSTSTCSTSHSSSLVGHWRSRQLVHVASRQRSPTPAACPNQMASANDRVFSHKLRLKLSKNTYGPSYTTTHTKSVHTNKNKLINYVHGGPA